VQMRIEALQQLENQPKAKAESPSERSKFSGTELTVPPGGGTTIAVVADRDELPRAKQLRSRDDFSARTKQLLAKRVGYHCSNPDCRRPTSGPQIDPSGSVSIGVAAHLTAAALGGPRFDRGLTPEQRQSNENGIWLCQTCATLIDGDKERFNLALLGAWKTVAEAAAAQDLRQRSISQTRSDVFASLDLQMPDLIAEMRQDLREHPLRREFVILERSWSYWAAGHELVYFFDDHPELRSMLHILQNQGLIREITYNNTERFLISEDFARYLSDMVRPKSHPAL
jgi:hypothetical protein